MLTLIIILNIDVNENHSQYGSAMELSTIFKAAAVLGSEILLNAWMHFTLPGLAFSASVAHAFGMTAGAATSAGMTATTAAGGGAALAF